MGVDAKRKKIIDGLLLELYKNNPSRVWATEDEINKEVTTNQTAQQISGITLNTIQPIAMPDALTGDLKTKVVKPNYWRTTGGFGINYTQNFFSDNWRSGGEKFGGAQIMGVVHSPTWEGVLAHKAAIDAHLADCGIPLLHTAIFRSEKAIINPSEIDPDMYRDWQAKYGK